MSPNPVSPVAGDAVPALFGRPKALIGVVHLLPLPGAPRYDGGGVEAIYARGFADARAYLEGGLDGVIVENHGDIPFSKPGDIGPEVAAHMAVITDRIRTACGSRSASTCWPMRRSPPWPSRRRAAPASSGSTNGPTPMWPTRACWTARPPPPCAIGRGCGQTGIRIFADAHVKHGAHAITGDRAVEELVRDLVFFDVDAIIATGQRTGHTADLGYIRAIKQASHLPTLVGSGVTPDNVADILGVVDGIIVASSLKHGGVWWNPVDIAAVRGLVAAAKLG